MPITIPKLSLVVLIGPSGSGKSTFARRHFSATEILSSDACRAMVGDDENDQTVTNEAFELLRFVAGKRLALGRLTVIDATNVQREARKPLVELARQYHCLPVAIVFDIPERICQERNRLRPDRDFGPHVVRNQKSQLRRSIGGLWKEGFRHVVTLKTPEEAETAAVERVPLWTDRREMHGPFDIIGDVHGCGDELEALLGQLGHVESCMEGDDPVWGSRVFAHPEGRKAVFLGDLVDRGPRNLDVVRLVRNMVRNGSALCVPGNHDMKLLKKLRGKNVQITHGLAKTLAEIDAVPDVIRGQLSKELADFLDGLVSHYLLDDGKLVVAHAGMKEEMQGRGSAKVRDFALYGETTGETDELGLPVRFDWANEYRGCGRRLRPHTGPGTGMAQPDDQHRHRLCLRGEPDGAALPRARARVGPGRTDLLRAGPPVPARRATGPVADGPASPRRGAGRRGRARQAKKHMGSRAVVIICRDENAARERFGITTGERGMIITRTGRRFWSDSPLEQAFLDRIGSALSDVDLWSSLETSWACLDCELMPWSAKAQELLRTQYAAVGSAGSASLPRAVAALEQAALRLDGPEKEALRAIEGSYRRKVQDVGRFIAAYRHYCWPVDSLADLKLAPFHLLASEGRVHTDQDHHWHMETLAPLCRADPEIFRATPYLVVDVADPASQAAGIAWWDELTRRGGEGMVIKPVRFIHRGSRGLAQPAVKCRGREYLRIIYGPEYATEENLARLRSRGLGRKRSLALGEFALGIEALERFVRGEPLRRVHECVFGVLALESEPVDPRL